MISQSSVQPSGSSNDLTQDMMVHRPFVQKIGTVKGLRTSQKDQK